MSNFWKRTISGILFVAVILWALWEGPISYVLLFAAITALTLQEFLNLCGISSKSPLRPITIAAGVLVFVLHFLVAGNFIETPQLIGLLALPLILAVVATFASSHQPVSDLAYALAALVYPATFMGALNYLVYQPSGGTAFNSMLVIGIFLLIWSYDTFAYLTGKWLGRHKLMPRLSPGKSWEGSAGGLLMSLLVALLLHLWIGRLDLVNWLVASVIASVAGTVGDLFESMLKRSANVKDSGSLIPGHGGMLDRLDAGLFVFPAILLYLQLASL
jgi:phosphatidate cytidylyltransferase